MTSLEKRSISDCERNKGVSLWTVGPTAELHSVRVLPLMVLSEIVPQIHNHAHFT